MAVRVYIMPAVLTSGNCWHPKYMFRHDLEMRTRMKARFQCKRFGDVDNPLRLVFVDTTLINHATLQGYSDVVSFSANLNNQVGSNLAAIKAQLKALGIPSKKLNGNNTWKQLVKGIIDHTESLKILHKDNVKDFIADNMNTLLVNLPQSVQGKVTNFLSNRGLTITLTSGMDVEDLLYALAGKINVTHKIEGEIY